MMNVVSVSFVEPLGPGDVWGEDARNSMVGRKIVLDGNRGTITECELNEDGNVIITAAFEGLGVALDLSSQAYSIYKNKE